MRDSAGSRRARSRTAAMTPTSAATRSTKAMTPMTRTMTPAMNSLSILVLPGLCCSGRLAGGAGGDAGDGCAIRHVAGDDGAGAGDGQLADGDGGDEHGVAADKCAFLDDGAVLLCA